MRLLNEVTKAVKRIRYTGEPVLGDPRERFGRQRLRGNLLSGRVRLRRHRKPEPASAPNVEVKPEPAPVATPKKDVAEAAKNPAAAKSKDEPKEAKMTKTNEAPWRATKFELKH